MKSAIIFIAHNRPKYFQQVLDSFSNVQNLSDYDLFFNLDGKNKENIKCVTKFLKSISYTITPDTIKINNTPLGCGANHKDGISRVFNLGYDYVICAEDDVIITNDTLYYFNKVCDLNYFIKCAFIPLYNIEEQIYLTYDKWFTPWVWLICKNNWNQLKDKIDWNNRWDHNITNYMIENDLLSLYPRSTRSQNIGIYGLNQNNGNTQSSTFTVSIIDDYDENIEYKMYK